jgi:hypothetical protein
MAKLYAELTSDKGGRVASKGGDDYIDVTIMYKNKQRYELRMTSQGDLYVARKKGGALVNIEDYIQLT